MNSHRLAFQMTHNREIKPGFVIAHQPKVCHNVLCCNPAHLRETTQAENMRDKYEDGTMPMGKSHPVARRFTEDQIRAIRADTRLLREIAMEYGCDYRNVSHIKRRTKYAWVEDLPSQS